jgi:hypothetical protein
MTTPYDDIKFSAEQEKHLYINQMPTLFANAVNLNGTLYDECFSLTSGFSNISAESILKNASILKVLRYAICPPISEMKFGQLFGFRTSSPFETTPPRPGSDKYTKLESQARDMAEFLSRQLDHSRFIWVNNPQSASTIAFDYARKWTCSVIANQRAETDYRSLRRKLQEDTITEFLEANGYALSAFRSTLQRPNDLRVGEFCKELKVQGRTVQKADVVFRCRDNGNLCLVEAKAVGVLLDATKRVKECCDKANEWLTGSHHLGNCHAFAVIAGFFSNGNLDALHASRINVVWEHRISDLLGFSACSAT